MPLGRVTRSISSAIAQGLSMCSATLEEYTTSKVPSAKGKAVPSPRTELLSVIPAAAISPASGSTPNYSAPRYSNSDRKSTRLNSSHVANSYAVFCLKKKTQDIKIHKHHNL